MEEEVPNASGSSIPISEYVSSTLSEETPDHPVLEDKDLFDKRQQEPRVSTVFQSVAVHAEGDVKGLCDSLVQSDTNDPEQIKTIEVVSLGQVHVGNSEMCPEIDVSSVRSDKLCPENKEHKISSDANDKDKQNYSSAQKVTHAKNIITHTISSDEVLVKSVSAMPTISSDEVFVKYVSTPVADKVQDGDLFIDLTTSETDALSNTSNRSDQDVEIKSDTSTLITTKSGNADDSKDVSKLTHITKNTGKFDNIFEAMTSVVEFDTENPGCILGNKSSDMANASSLPHALQTDLDSNITSNDDKWVDKAISLNASSNAVQNNKIDPPSTLKDIGLGSNEECDKNKTSNFQSDESILNEISKICDQVNMADDSERYSPPVETVSGVEDSNLTKSQDVENFHDPVITASVTQELYDIENNNPEMPTNCPKIDMRYSLSSEAERQEEIMAMQRDLYEDEIENTTNSIQHSTKDCSPTLLSVSDSGHQDRSEQPATVMTSSPALRVKEEPMDYEDYPAVEDQVKSNEDLSIKSLETTTAAADDPVDSNELLMSEIMSLNSSQTLLDLASKHLESLSAVVGEKSVVIENVGSTPSPFNIIDSQTQNLIKSLENFDLEWIKGNDSVRYKPPRIPLKLRDSFGKGPYSCLGCGDSFLFESSLETHLNRKCLEIVCKNDQCLNTSTIPEFYNRCSYLIHFKQHQKKSVDPNLEVSFATDDLLQNIGDLVEPSASQAYCAEFKSSLEFSWTCSECNIQFDSAKALASHFVPNQDSFPESQCDICKKHLYTECSLSAHRRSHSKEKPYVCPECGQLFLGNWEAFSKHLNTKCFHTHRQPSLTCQKCNITGTSFEKMTQHLLCHKEVYMKCHKCPMAFKAMKTFQTHMKTTHAIKDDNFPHGEVFKCSMCDTVFHNLDHLTIHTSKHVEQFNKKPKYHFKCWLCPCTLNNRVGIERHLLKQHRIKPCKTLCDLCGSHFENLAELLTHLEMNGCSQSCNPTNIKTADGTLTYQDEFVVQPALEQNLDPPKIKLKIKKKKASVVSPDTNNFFKCSICDYKCNKANVSDVNTHIRKHRADGIYLCSICLTAVYDTFTDLHRHQFMCRKKKAGKKGSPSKDNPTAALTCQKCLALFPTDVKLTEHMLTEHGVAPQFPCHLCGLTYDTQHSLHQHIQLVHEGKKHLYLCWICQSKNTKRTFTAVSKLERHLVVKHRVPRNIIDPDKFPRLLPGLNQKDTIIDLAPGQEKDASNKQVPIKRLKLADDTVYSCAKCEFSTENRDEFEVHIKTHKTESTSRQCPECGLCFSVLPSLKKHLIMVHKIKDISTYVRTSGLDEIQPIEPSTVTKSPNPASLSDIENPLECRVCYKSFDSEISLKKHMRTHGMAYIRSKKAPTTFPSRSLVTDELKSFPVE